MKETIIATYKRESTLWKNANAFYVSQDWTKMECGFQDWSDMRKTNEEMDFRYIDKRTGEDITEKVNEERYYDRYIIRLTNKRGTNSKTYNFRTKEEANAFFKEIMKDKVLSNFQKI